MHARNRRLQNGRKRVDFTRSLRRLGFERLESRRLLAGDLLHNADAPADVDGDGRVTRLDMFIAIDALRQSFQSQNVGLGEDSRQLYLDVDNNQRFNVLDGFLIQRELRGEGEGTATAVISVVPLSSQVINGFDDIQNGTQNATLFNAGNNTIVQENGAGDPVDWTGFSAGNEIIVANSDLNDGRYTITNVNANVLTIDSATPLTTESNAATIFRVIDTIGFNSNFQLGVFGEDRRAEPLGLFSVYTDVVFDDSLATATQLNTQSAEIGGPTANFFYGDFTNGKKGDISTPGLVDEAGAFAGLNPTGDVSHLIFTVDMRSGTNGGVVDFLPDAAEISPGNDVLSYGEEQGETIPNCTENVTNDCFGQVMFQSASLTIASTITALPDTAQVDENAGPTFIDVLANDSSLTATEPSIAGFQPFSLAGGIVQPFPNPFNPSGLQYTPPRDFVGTDFFFYDITNGEQNAFARVTINVGPVDAAPVISGPNSLSTNEDVTLDLNGFSIFDTDSNNITVTLTANGQLSQTTFSGTPSEVTNTLNSLTYSPIPDSTANDTIIIDADDGGLSDSHTVNITINPINDPPANTVPGPQSLFNTQTLSFTNNEFQVSDIDASQLEVTLQVSQGTIGVNGNGLQVQGNNSASLTATGSITNLNNALNTLLYDPNDTFFGNDTLIMTTSDLGATGAGGALTDTDSVTLEVSPPQLPFAASDSFTTNEGAGSFQLDPNPLDNDLRDVDATLNLLGIVGAPSNSGGAVTFANGNFTYTPPTNIDFFGTETFTYTIEQDPHPSTTGDSQDSGTITIEILPINDGPINSLGGNPIPSTSPTLDGVEDEVLQFTNTNALTISDIDAGEEDVTLTLTVTNGILSITDTNGASGNNSGQLTIDGTVGQVNNSLSGLTYTPNFNFFGNDSLLINTNDNGHTGANALSDTDTVNITIQPVNDPPTLVVPGSQSFFTDFDNRFSSDPAPFSIADDSADNDIEVDLTIGDGELTITPTTGVTVTQNPNSQNGIRISGTVNNINDALAGGLDYNSSQPGDKTLNVVVNDLGNTGGGPPLTAEAQVEVEVLDFVPIDILGQVFVDHDNNGNKDRNDPAIEGVDVILSGIDFQGLTLNLTETTNSRGEYMFHNLRPNQPGSPYTITQMQPVFIQDYPRTTNQARLDLDANGNVSVTDGTLDFGDGGFVPEFADVWRLFGSAEKAPNNSAILFGFDGKQDWSIMVGAGWDANRFSFPRFFPLSDGNSGVLTVFDNLAERDRTVNVSTREGTMTYRGTGDNRVYRIIGDSSLLDDDGEGESDDDIVAVDEAIESMYA